jgi:hypothetical protein
MSTESERIATRERVRRFRERQKQEQEQLIRDKFEQGIRKLEPTKSAFEADANFLRECSRAVDVLLEADAFLLWTMYPSESKSLQIPLPMHITADNVDDAISYVEAFAREYEQNPMKRGRWAEAMRLCLLDGLVFDYRLDGGTVCVRVVPGTRDLYRQLCKRLGKELPTAFVKPGVVPTVPHTSAADLENRFLSRCLAIDKNLPLLPAGEGVIGKLLTGSRSLVVWEFMSDADQRALATKVQKEFAGFCEGRGTQDPVATTATPIKEEIEV